MDEEPQIPAGAPPISWNTHALITRAALAAPSWRRLDDACRVASLEEFVESAGDHLNPIIRWYEGLLADKLGRIPPRREGSSSIRTVEAFFGALRTGPDYRPSYVILSGPDGSVGDAPHDPGREGPPGPAYTETRIGEEISFRDILCCYSDEPDWGMDMDLFGADGRPFGPSPFGGNSGMSSQAAFHMDFRFGSPVVRTLLPRLGTSFMEERVRVFFTSARLAFNISLPYWGARFTAWAMHYLQDLTQPYHAKPFPFGLLFLFRKAAPRASIGSFMESNTNLLRNRHLLFEAAVHYLLNDALKTARDHPFIPALAGDDDDACSGTIQSVMRECGETASRLAASANRSLTDLMLDERLNDPSYALIEDSSYRIDITLPEAARLRPERMERFIRAVCPALRQAGRVTRFAAARMESSMGM